MAGYTQAARLLSLNTVLGPDELLVREFSGWEAISKPFHFDVDLLSENDAIDIDSLIGTPATLQIGLADGSPRYWNAYIRQITQGWRGPVFTSYRAQLVPWLWMLGLKRDSRIFQELDVPGIIRKVFEDLGFKDFAFRLEGTFASREYCVQYRETDLNFVMRLMETEGIFFFFEHAADRHVLVMANSPAAHPPCPGQSSVTCRSGIGGRWDEDFISDWRHAKEYVSSGSALNDYNFKTPTQNLHTRINGKGPLEIYDHPGNYLDKPGGEALNRVRMQAILAGDTVATGESSCRVFTTGHRFTLQGHYRDAWNQSYVLTEVRHRGTQTGNFLGDEVSEGQEPAYQNTFACIPYATAFRPTRETPVPVVEGCQTAMVVGPPGEEIYTDELGRIKVQFHWDRIGQRNEKSSCWIRVAQSWAGRRWGALVIPRIGQEVVVDFLEGDPDRPLVTGAVYNAQMVPPYSLPGEKDTTGVKSDSTIGSGGCNELRLRDKKGAEQIFVQAERDHDIRVKHDSKTYVGRERHAITKADSFDEVGGDQHTAIKGDQNQEVSGTASLKIGMDLQAKIGTNYALDSGMEIHLKAGTNFVLESGVSITLKAGSNFITLSPGGVFISGTMVFINTGGAAGVGAGASPQPPKAALEPELSEPGLLPQPPKPSKPPKPDVFGAKALTLQAAAQRGTPFCEICNG